MKALLVKDELHWHKDWSSRLGTMLETKDSSNNLLIFGKTCSEEDILTIIGQAPREIYQILDLEEATEEDCDFMADSGTCYRKLH